MTGTGLAAQVVVRVAGPGDFAGIAALTVAAYQADGQLDGEHGYAAVLADVPARASGGELFVAVDAATGDLLGAVTFVLHDSPYAELCGPGEAEFRMLAVSPAAQGRGAGYALVRACLARAEELGRTAVVICVREGFAATARRMYERLGFVRTPQRDWTPAPGIDLLAMRLDLPA